MHGPADSIGWNQLANPPSHHLNHRCHKTEEKDSEFDYFGPNRYGWQKPRDLFGSSAATVTSVFPKLSFNGLKTYNVPGTINGVFTNALPDTGSSINAISENFVTKLNLKVEPTNNQSVPTLGKRKALVVGRTVGLFSFEGERDTYRLDLHVLRDSVCDLLLGREFVSQRELFTKFRRCVAERDRVCALRGTSLFLLQESPGDHLRCAVNGYEASAIPDSGSELMLISRDFAQRNKFKVHDEPECRRDVTLIDGSIIRTDGMVLDAQLEFDIPPTWQELDYHRFLAHTNDILSHINQQENVSTKSIFLCDLHVINDLPCDILLSNEFTYQAQVFSRFRSLFCSRPTSSISGSGRNPNHNLLFMRLKRQWQQRERENTISELFMLYDQHLGALTSIASSQGGPSWSEIWRTEEKRRNDGTLRISCLPEPQRSIEQRSEHDKRAQWDRDNPRPQLILPIRQQPPQQPRR
ncbi:uncharacterized protein F4822DRAFT_427351 [Hypoxylon trugodes]|uniref:uncharacterized protein n=1 Tax=Hypoxylon trugodes TaxID=326681 RepID=UPI00219EC95C|nr:uncharacterized protein F4822DRAFT_427351 [Hypoxylon trugodes]KAI1391504.1 hypothetical protein F4822DRAFT_427351 [Hypoxylon trugodes]